MHRHKAVRSVDRCYSGPVNLEDQNPMAHGNIRVTSYCSCGAQKDTNINGCHSETSGWYTEEEEGEED